MRNFNRGDSIDYTFKVANVSENKYYVTEANCIGFRIICTDKRTDSKKIKSERSDQVLIIKKIVPNGGHYQAI